MADDDQPRVLSVSSFVGIQLIDGGDTVALQFRAPDGRDVAVLVPREPASDLHLHLTAALAQSLSRNR